MNKRRGAETAPLTGTPVDLIFNLMVNYQTDSLDAVFSALGDPTRRAILAQLAEGESRVSELAAPHEMSLPAISKHLKVLETAGLISRERDGRVIRCNLDAGPLREAADWIDQYRVFWEGQFDQLARYLERTSKDEEKKDD